MSPSNKMDGATGIVTVALGFISGSFTAEDFHTWGQTIMSLSPFVLILFLLWRIWKMDKQLKDKDDQLIKTQDKLDLLYSALTSTQVRRNLPSACDFRDGNFEAPIKLGQEN
jgi:hypothetical protein